ncbi:MAG TPA: MlaD family protein [Candidatus Eremiobacteraceae bacterium]|nr:MlaD family protein [Candidatus Eremiobacteraceae bacterium]
MSTQFRVGIFAVVTVIALFVVWYVLSNYSLRKNAYQTAIHFRNVSGLQEGSSVQLSGVVVGEVERIQLLPDQTVDVICTISGDHTIYRGSTILVTTTLTGQSTLSINPPANLANAQPLPRGILPIEQQAEGTLPPSITDLAAQGQAQLKQLDKTLTIVNQELPTIARRFNGVASHTDALILHTDETFRQLSGQLTATIGHVDALIASTQSVLAESGRNVNQLTGTMRSLVVDNQVRISKLIGNLADTASNLNKTMQTISQITADPSVKANLIQTTTNIKDSSEKLKQIATDIESITGDSKVQGRLRGAVDDLSSAIAKADDILGGFSSAQGHEEPPGPHASPPPGGTAYPVNLPTPAASPGDGTAPRSDGGLQRNPIRSSGGHGSLLANLTEIQVRETWGTHGGGPASDMNVVLLPRAPTHISAGANDLGYKTTYNFLIDTVASPRLQYSLGVIYSNLGLKTVYRPAGPLGIDARLYDPRHPKLDLYGDVRLTQRLQLFYGERSLFGSNKLPSFGFQVNY